MEGDIGEMPEHLRPREESPRTVAAAAPGAIQSQRGAAATRGVARAYRSLGEVGISGIAAA
jgi:hypothetical protein